jgi:FtsP/CotA-like multicopper oxidase with cupredoxin domain
MRSIFCILLQLAIAGTTQAQTTRNIDVILRSNIGIDTMWDGTPLRVFGMTSKLMNDPDIPAPTIYCNEGDSVILHARSISQGDHHTIHLHGLDVDTRNDGDPATSFSLSHMEDTTYTFIAHHAGTFIYHCHMADVIHVQMGMYGLVVVKAGDDSMRAWTGGPSFDRSFEWLLSEIDSAWHNNIPYPDLLVDTVNVPPYRPSYFLINGKSETQLAGKRLINIVGAPGQTLYVRLANIGFFKNRVIFPTALRARVVDSDGRPLDESVDTDTIEVAPGERYGVLLQPTEMFSGSVAVQYRSMNTGEIWNTQNVTVAISPLAVGHDSELHSAPYPNPAANLLHVPFEGHYAISDIMGVVRLEGRTDGEIQLGTLPPGSYRLVSSGLSWKFAIVK